MEAYVKVKWIPELKNIQDRSTKPAFRLHETCTMFMLSSDTDSDQSPLFVDAVAAVDTKRTLSRHGLPSERR
ncbi:hypothetical protein RTCIAT899_PC08915 (plasmid) [Rhizobium tropici CIAT 899]|uniref:Uncharacterized protein n=1 Tax=Rhizobium tropici TaxID=398 RepID=A0ABR6QZB5_RHITR|nr:hypothetical protein RTCIAT899_PC08915 [Rhizobium tropici CIAT 899]MBB4241944.1 hypothetical protein [Rhizobium tropici]MBB5593410.1 hypothetical protein [Rhizobium tropici]MBB6492269.1 hypothetical protein [Rhizobium tropici]TGE97440.1 hypothetical protein C9417_12995 [Rhizobium sp. SEMIA 4088]